MLISARLTAAAGARMADRETMLARAAQTATASPGALRPWTEALGSLIPAGTRVVGGRLAIALVAGDRMAGSHQVAGRMATDRRTGERMAPSPEVGHTANARLVADVQGGSRVVVERIRTALTVLVTRGGASGRDLAGLVTGVIKAVPRGAVGVSTTTGWIAAGPDRPADPGIAIVAGVREGSGATPTAQDRACHPPGQLQPMSWGRTRRSWPAVDPSRRRSRRGVR